MFIYLFSTFDALSTEIGPKAVGALLTKCGKTVPLIRAPNEICPRAVGVTSKIEK